MRRILRVLRPLVVVVPALVGIAGAWLGLVVGGAQTTDMGPFRVRLEGAVGSGQTVVGLPPFGHITADTHTAPLQLEATLQNVDVQGLSEAIEGMPTADLAARVEAEARRSIRPFALRILGTTAAGALVLALLVYRRDLRKVGVAVGAAVLVVGGIEIAAWRTYRPEAFAEPTFSGSLELAPQLVGPVREVSRRIDEFRAELERIVDGAVRTYTALEPDGPANGDVVRVLHISDIHLSPLGTRFAQEIAQGFDIDLVLDTGDLTSYGTPAEQVILSEIPRFELPYVFVRGNHDSMDLQRAMRDVPNAIVLDGRAKRVEGLRIYGLGHPAFTEDKTADLDHPQLVAAARGASPRILDDLEAMSRPPDVVAVHDDRMAEDLAGRVPLVVSGHFHDALTAIRRGTLYLRVGSTGGAGVNIFSEDGGVPLSAQILTFSTSGLGPQLVAYDKIEQSPTSGNLTVRRHRVSELRVAEDAERHRREVDRLLQRRRTPEPGASPSPSPGSPSPVPG